MMTRKERMRRAIRREPVDHLPFQTNYTGAMGRRMAEHFGVKSATYRRGFAITCFA